MNYPRGLGLYDDEDELERRRQADALGGLNASSPDDWISQQADRNPAWMRKQPDMNFSLAEAEQAPDMHFGLDEAERAPDMTFGLDEAENAPDMDFSLAETERPDMQFSLAETERPDMSFTLADTEQPPAAMRLDARSQPVSQAAGFLDGPRRAELGAIDTGDEPNIEDEWGRAERTALQRSGYLGDDSYGAGEAIRDFAPMLIGGGLDLAFNKGRGLGNIAVGGAHALGEERERRDKQHGRAADDAIAIRRQRQYADQAGLRAGDQELGWANYAERVKQGTRLGEKQDFEINPNNPQAQAMDQHVKDLTGVDQSGLSVKQQGQAMPLARGVQELQNAPLRAAAVTRAESDTEHELAPRTAADAGDKAAEVEARARPEKMITAGEEKDLKNPAIDSGGAPLLPPGIRDTTGRFSQLALRNPEEATRTVNTVQDMTKLEGITGEMVKIRQAIDKIPMNGRTRNNPEFAKLLGAWDENEGAYQAEYFKAQDRGAPQIYEDKRFQGQIGQPMTLEDSVGQPIAALRSALTNQENLLKGRQQALQQRRQAFVEAKFGPQGAAPSGVGGRQNLGPDAGHPSNLGVTGKPPPIPASAPAPSSNGKRMLTVESPDGQIERLELSDEEADYLRTQHKARVY